MIALTQNVKKASVVINSENIAEIKRGLLIFLCVEEEDNTDKSLKLINRIINHKIFWLENDLKTRLSIKEIKGEILVVSQFTLCANNHKGHKPSFSHSAKPQVAKELYENFLNLLKEESGLIVKSGIFGEMMEVNLTNEGPYTLLFKE
jgi:D-tyrosyl-tRNA(Tyr) deacylase